MSRNCAVVLIVILFAIIPLTLAMPVFLSEIHAWIVARKFQKRHNL